MSLTKAEKVLQKRVDFLHEKMRKLRDAELNRLLNKLVGNCYKNENSYGSVHPGQKWAKYYRVISITRCLTFQIDCVGRIIIDNVVPNPYTLETKTKIKFSEFEREWSKMINKIVEISP